MTVMCLGGNGGRGGKGGELKATMMSDMQRELDARLQGSVTVFHL